MVKDNFEESKMLPITAFAKRIIDPINRVIGAFREQQWPIVFSTDAYRSDDFIFTGSMRPHSLAGTKGAEVVDELDRRGEDLWLPKPRFSAFFRSGLEEWLRERKVSLCAVTGIATNFCVLATVLDAICFDFKVVLLEDCTAASSQEVHEQTVGIYRRNPLYPLLKVITSIQWMRDVLANGK
jgi:nicotinamidase-related amidase